MLLYDDTGQQTDDADQHSAAQDPVQHSQSVQHVQQHSDCEQSVPQAKDEGHEMPRLGLVHYSSSDEDAT